MAYLKIRIVKCRRTICSCIASWVTGTMHSFEHLIKCSSALQVFFLFETWHGHSRLTKLTIDKLFMLRGLLQHLDRIMAPSSKEPAH